MTVADQTPAGTELRRRARAQTLRYLAALALPDPAESVRAWTQHLGDERCAAEVHVIVDALTGTATSPLLALRDALRTTGGWCREHGQPVLAERYLRAADLLDIADRQLYQLGIDHLTAFHTEPCPPGHPHREDPAPELP
ncbi:hypothetical protein [Streptomyces sp. NBC_00691]|uniref:hypothetical protein n=1 Tax=Streptomyces sp. NBC_00691 TaxID=2903671 RepID=UPI002E34B8FD|nr:hypothetical protein [Streptomyces sp. NBC_00691]